MDRNASTLIRADHRGGRRATQRDEPRLAADTAFGPRERMAG